MWLVHSRITSRKATLLFIQPSSQLILISLDHQTSSSAVFLIPPLVPRASLAKGISNTIYHSPWPENKTNTPQTRSLYAYQMRLVVGDMMIFIWHMTCSSEEPYRINREINYIRLIVSCRVSEVIHCKMKNSVQQIYLLFSF